MPKPLGCGTGFKCINIFQIFEIKYECFYKKINMSKIYSLYGCNEIIDESLFL